MSRLLAMRLNQNFTMFGDWSAISKRSPWTKQFCAGRC